MAVMFLDSFDIYGSGSAGRTRMLDSVWAAVSSQIFPDAPSFGARTGTHALFIQATNSQSARRVLSSAVSEAYAAFAFYAVELPDAADRIAFCQFRSAGNAEIVSVTLSPDGSMDVRAGAVNDTIVASTNGPVIGAAAWNHIEVRVVRDNAAGIVQIWVNDQQVLNATGLSLGTVDMSFFAVQGKGAGSGEIEYWMDDLVVTDTTGSYNTGRNGDLRVATLFPDGVDSPDGWAKYGTDKFGNGVFDPDGGCCYVDDQAGFAIGSGDYTAEAFVRFKALSGTDEQTLFGQFDESNNERSWRLFRDGATGAIKLEISTDGTLATVAEIINWTGWQPVIGRYYHIAVSRVSGTTYLFVDGRMQGAGQADANTYHDSTSPVWVGTQLQGTGPNVLKVDSLATFDEFRFTVGTGRYSANFNAPTAAFPRSAPSDPDFADVELLLGFNESPIVDESSNGFTVDVSTEGSPTVLDTTADAAGKYAVLDENPPLDDTYVAADFTYATGELTLTGNPTDTETVTLGSITYAFVNTLVSANDVLIGADIDESLQNLAAAIIGGAGEGTVYGTGTTANTDAGAEWLGAQQLRATAAAQGTAGNSVASTETLAAGSWTDTTLTGGTNIPSAQTFTLSPLPIDTTQVRAIQVYSRAFKTDAGAANLQTSFTVAGATDAGGDNAVTTQPTYYTDIFEEDPDTTAGLTVNSITSGLIQINRTT